MKMKWIALVVMSAGLLAFTASAQEKAAPFKDQKAKESYSLGYQFGRNLTGQGVEINKDILINGNLAVELKPWEYRVYVK